MTVATILGLLTLVVGVPLNLWVTSRLRQKAAGRPDLKVLQERLLVARALLLLVTVFGLIFVSNDATPPWIELGTTKIITRLTILIVAIVPAAFWLWLYRKLR